MQSDQERDLRVPSFPATAGNPAVAGKLAERRFLSVTGNTTTVVNWRAACDLRLFGPGGDGVIRVALSPPSSFECG
jgi:hypothetical protein